LVRWGDLSLEVRTEFYLDDIRLDAHYERQIYMPLVLRNYPSQGGVSEQLSRERVMFVVLLTFGVASALVKRAQ
jgi:hypothetical protein